jgi:7-cyano-7-deazaguanine synthase
MKTVVILSGGMDSTTLLYEEMDQGNEVAALSVNYGQRHVRELECAEYISGLLLVPWELVDLTSITHLLRGSSQTDKSVPVPKGHYAEESMKATIIPNRNMMMLSVAVAWALAQGADKVAYAAHAGDHAIYPDCRPDFVAALNKAIALADWRHVTLEAPFINWTKQEILKRGVALGVPYEETWTCYEGNAIACGQCGTCVERLEAFAMTGIDDPLHYADRDFWREAIARR